MHSGYKYAHELFCSDQELEVLRGGLSRMAEWQQYRRGHTYKHVAKAVSVYFSSREATVSNKGFSAFLLFPFTVVFMS